MMIVNKFTKHCSVCGKQVPAGEGYARLETSQTWLTYCARHAPQDEKPVSRPAPKGPATPAPADVSIKPAPKKVLSGVRRLEADGKIIIEPWTNDLIELALLKSMPGRVYHPEGRYWTVSTAPKDRREVLDFAKRLKLDVDPAWGEGAKTRAQDAEQHGLYHYQVEGVEWLSQQKRALLADEMGLGKTIESIMALEDDEKVLVVCPANVKYNWRAEFNAWRPGYKVTILNHRNTFRWPERGEAVICNYDILPDWLVPPGEKKSAAWMPQDLIAARGTTLICDEVHAVKNGKSKRHKQVKQLSYKCKKVWFLTGTPLMNKANDLLGLLFALNRFNDTFGTIDNFVNVFNVPHNGFGYEWGQARPGPEVPNLLRRVMMRRLREEVLPELPELQHQTLLLDSEGTALKLLDAKWEECRGEFKAEEILPKLVEFGKLRRELAKERIPTMTAIVEDFEEQEVPLVVFSAHREPIDTLAKRAGWAVITGDTPASKRKEVNDAFQRGKLKGIGLTIQAGGIGINLTYAWTALMVDLDWTPGLNEQAVRRLLRIGQKNNVRILHMVSNHPLDIRLHDTLLDKGRFIMETVG